MHKRMRPEDLEALFGVVIPSYDGCYGKGRDGITEKQRNFIHNLGVNVTGLRYKKQAMVVIDAIIRRNEAGLATVKQIQTLHNLGVKTRKPLATLTMKEATALLSKHLSY